MTRVSQVLQGYCTGEIEISGWLKTKRDSKNVIFLALNDGSCPENLQVVVDTSAPAFALAETLGTGAAITVTGEVVESPADGQDWEIIAKDLTVVGPADSTYPLQKKRHTFEYLRTISHLRPRANTFQSVFRVRNRLSFAVHQFFQSRGFMYVQTPIITASDCEGAGEMFQVTTLEPGQTDLSQDFFGKRTGLTVSGQLEAELFAMAFKDVYTFGPTFRAENSNTSRHAAEFWMIEPEMAFADLDADCQIAEDFVKYLTNAALNDCASDLDFFDQRIEKGLIKKLEDLARKPFATMTYTAAIDELLKAKCKFDFPVSWGCDLQTEHERYLTEQVVNGPVFVVDYPKDIKAFYMKMNDDDKTVAAMDLLVPRIGELIGGSQREDNLDILDKRMVASGINPEDMWWYRDIRKWGNCPHAGFGLGFERFLMYATGMENIRDVIPFPRTPGNAGF